MSGVLIVFLFAAILVLMGMSFFFSSAETAFFSLDPLSLRRLSQRHPRAGRCAHDLLAQPKALLSSILIGNTSVNVAIAAIGFLIADQIAPGYGEAISIPIVTVLLVIFCEAGPKSLGLAFTERLVTLYAVPLRLLVRVCSPLRRGLDAMTRRLEPFMRARGTTLSEEEFETVLDVSEEQGVINADELAMIKAIVNLEDLKAHDVMRPRVDLLGLDLNEDPAAWLARARTCKRKFLLMYRDDMDNVEGFLDVRRFLLDPAHDLARAKLKPFFVPETIPLNQLLVRFQKERIRIAVVVDEYGGTAGVISRGDILEEITGEIFTELSKPRPIFQPAGPHRWLVDANIPLEELNRKLRLHLNADEATRLAGWIAHHLGDVPEQKEVVETQGVRVTVMQTQKRRVTLAQIEKLEAAS